MSGKALLAGFLAALLLLGCGRENQHPPDQLLVDSLGLEESDQVFRVELSLEEGGDAVRPAEVTIPPGAFVEFVTTDRALHTVTFSLDELPSGAADFLRSTRQAGSPPLIELGSRFVVSFEDAPAGRYPYVVEGNGAPGAGVIVVTDGEEDG